MSEPACWGVEGHHDEDLRGAWEDAVDDYLDHCWPNWPRVVEVQAYRRMEVVAPAWGPLEDLLERLDEDYGDRDGATQPTEGMKRAEKVFIDAVLSEYVPWQCEPIDGRVEVVDVADFARVNGMDLPPGFEEAS